MKYCVIIVTYNRISLLKECLQCIENQSKRFYRIIVVDNCSTDGTTDFLDDFANDREDVVLIKAKHNLGGAGGFELGVRNLPNDIDYALLIDDDAMLNTNFLELIDSNIEKDILAYSGTVKTDGIIDLTHRRRIKNSVFMLKENVALEEYSGKSFYYDLSSFCGLIIKKKLIDKIGYPKGDYFIWYDDTEYSLRVIKHTRIKNINAAIINHKTKISNENTLTWKSYYGYRNQIDIGKNYSKVPVLYKAYRFSYHYYRILFFMVRKLVHPANNYYSECVKLHKKVVHDSRLGVLGLSKTYFPGKKLF